MNEFKPSIVEIAEICARKHLRRFVLSPGSRSAPLALAFLRHPELSCRMVVDERAAGFVALGMAQQLAEPVGLVCTSGTAALNYAPAVTEAFYQEVPLVVFTADRPPEWIDQNDGQTIHQRNLYGDHCRASIDLPVDDSHPDARWQIQRSVSEAINLTRWPVSGPVHINVPLREPLYPDARFVYPEEHRLVSVARVRTDLAGETWEQLLEVWRRSKKRLVVAGLHRPDPVLSHHLESLSHLGGILLADVTSNCHVPQEIPKFDAILGASPSVLQELAPDLLITLGGPVVSKNLKLFLRKFKPRAHWQLQPHARCIDPFQSLTQIIPTSPAYFFSELSRRMSGELEKSRAAESEAYPARWQGLASRAEEVLSTVLNEFPDCELSAMDRILRHLPPGSNLQLGNSSIVRWANLLGFADAHNCTVNSNRGTSGIDGTVSTAVGAALATSRLTTLVVGDLAFFYDRNGLWQKDLPPNLRIVIFNNRGGAIFRILDGAKDLPELAEYFEVEHDLTARRTAEDYGLGYESCDSVVELAQRLPDFFAEGKGPAILELRIDKEMNASSFFRLKSLMREIR